MYSTRLDILNLAMHEHQYLITLVQKPTSLLFHMEFHSECHMECHMQRKKICIDEYFI